MVVAIAFVSSMGMKSLWLSVHGAPVNGCVVPVEPDTNRASTGALVGLAALAGVVHAGFVPWWPARKREKSAAKPEVDRGCLQG